MFTMKINVLVIEDNVFMRRGIQAVINEFQDCLAYGISSDCHTGYCRLNNAIPDILVTHMRGCRLSNVQSLHQFFRSFPEVPVLLLTDCTDVYTIRRVIGFGVRGYLLHSCCPDELHRAIRHVQAGEVFITEQFRARVLENIILKHYIEDDRFRVLFSPRQLEIMFLLANGFSTKEIADKLMISRKTVNSHYKSMKLKLGYESTAELRHFATENISYFK